jgi:hypothetical protein
VTFLPVESNTVGLYALALSIISFNWFAYNISISTFTRSPLTATIVPLPFMSNTYVYNIDSKNVM